jgi:hypothetical protein
MVPAQLHHNALEKTLEELDVSSFGPDEFTEEDYCDDDVVSLLEENARLRKLVIRLSEIVLRNVANDK